MKYRIVAVTTQWWKTSNYIIEKKTWWWPFWIDATCYSYETIKAAKIEIERLKTCIVYD